ncbi:MaoC/PaaZ C-terminal domain-containing protein [Streptosporangium sp. NPDC051022]|uniref:MaoC/PaaZ C-terminal domain-containing protein n=1 Tax=Streptosporangium sp. NPDC051022 TaxID=3155752 RepID=UPI003420FB28
MTMNLSAVGDRGPTTTTGWTRDDVMLYAIAVGAGQRPDRELSLTTENSDGVRPQVLPTFAALLSQRAVRPSPGEYDPAMVLHAEQHVTVHAPLPSEGTVSLTAHLEAIHDKGSGAVVRTRTVGVLEGKDTPAFEARSAIFIRGAGGFGGERGVSEPWAAPEREPDHVERFTLRPEQALLYRLTGDRNPLHADPVFAARAGFARPILHGMCAYGFSARGLVAAFGGDPDALRAVGGRFSATVEPGDELTVEIWATGDGALFRTRRGDGTVVLDRGRALRATGLSGEGRENPRSRTSADVGRNG